MKIFEVAKKISPEDRAWAKKWIPAGPNDPEGRKILNKLNMPADRGFILTDTEDVSMKRRGDHKGIYILFSRNPQDPDGAPIYFYIGLAGPKSYQMSNLITDRNGTWKHRYPLNWAEKIGTAPRSEKLDDPKDPRYKWISKAQTDEDNTFDGWIRGMKVLLTPESFDRLITEIKQNVKDGVFLHNGAWQPWTATETDPKDPSKFIGPTGLPTKHKRWIRTRDYSDLDLEYADSEKFMPFAILNMNDYEPAAIDWAEYQFINLYQPVSNSDRQSYDPNEKVGLKTTDMPGRYAKRKFNAQSPNLPDSQLLPDEHRDTIRKYYAQKVGKHYPEWLSSRSVFTELTKNIPDKKISAFKNALAKLYAEHRYNLNSGNDNQHSMAEKTIALAKNYETAGGTKKISVKKIAKPVRKSTETKPLTPEIDQGQATKIRTDLRDPKTTIGKLFLQVPRKHHAEMIPDIEDDISKGKSEAEIIDTLKSWIATESKKPRSRKTL